MMMRGFVWFWLLVFVTGCASTAEREAERTRRERLIDTHLQLATNYLQRGQLDVAMQNIEKALNVDSDHSQANNMMAILQWRFKDYDAAERYFNRAVRDRNNSEAQNNFGAFLCEQKRVDEAERWFRRAIDNPLYKTPALANENAGLCLFRAGEIPRAEKYFREALRIDPRLPNSLYHMAHITYESRRTLAARGFIQRFFEAADDTPEALLLAVKIERNLRNKDDEASYAVRLRGKFPTSPEAQQLQKPVPAGRKG